MTDKIGNVACDIFTSLLCRLWKRKIISNGFFLIQDAHIILINLGGL